MATDGLAILAAIQGFTKGIAEGMESKRKIDLAERELAFKEDETKTNKELRGYELLLKERNRKDTVQYRQGQLSNYDERTDIFRKSVEQKGKQAQQKYASEEDREDDKFYKTLGTDLRGYRKSIFDIEKKVTELEETKLRMNPEEQAPYDKLIQKYQTQLDGLNQESESVKMQMDSLLQKRSSPQVKSAIKGLVNEAKANPTEANALVSAIKGAKSKAEILQAHTKLQTLPNYPGKEELKKLIKDRIRELAGSGQYK